MDQSSNMNVDLNFDDAHLSSRLLLGTHQSSLMETNSSGPNLDFLSGGSLSPHSSVRDDWVSDSTPTIREYYGQTYSNQKNNSDGAISLMGETLESSPPHTLINSSSQSPKSPSSQIGYSGFGYPSSFNVLYNNQMGMKNMSSGVRPQVPTHYSPRFNTFMPTVSDWRSPFPTPSVSIPRTSGEREKIVQHYQQKLECLPGRPEKALAPNASPSLLTSSISIPNPAMLSPAMPMTPSPPPIHSPSNIASIADPFPSTIEMLDASPTHSGYTSPMNVPSTTMASPPPMATPSSTPSSTTPSSTTPSSTTPTLPIQTLPIPTLPNPALDIRYESPSALPISSSMKPKEVKKDRNVRESTLGPTWDAKEEIKAMSPVKQALLQHLLDLRLPDLKVKLKEISLPVSGNKPDLVKIFWEHVINTEKSGSKSPEEWLKELKPDHVISPASGNVVQAESTIVEMDLGSFLKKAKTKDLRSRLKALGLNHSGNKTKLIELMTEYVNSSERDLQYWMKFLQGSIEISEEWTNKITEFLNNLSVQQIRNKVKELGLTTVGTKSQMIGALNAFVSASSQEPEYWYQNFIETLPIEPLPEKNLRSSGNSAENSQKSREDSDKVQTVEAVAVEILDSIILGIVKPKAKTLRSVLADRVMRKRRQEEEENQNSESGNPKGRGRSKFPKNDIPDDTSLPLQVEDQVQVENQVETEPREPDAAFDHSDARAKFSEGWEELVDSLTQVHRKKFVSWMAGQLRDYYRKIWEPMEKPEVPQVKLMPGPRPGTKPKPFPKPLPTPIYPVTSTGNFDEIPENLERSKSENSEHTNGDHLENSLENSENSENIGKEPAGESAGEPAGKLGGNPAVSAVDFEKQKEQRRPRVREVKVPKPTRPTGGRHGYRIKTVPTNPDRPSSAVSLRAINPNGYLCPLKCLTNNGTLASFPNIFNLERHIRETRVHKQRTIEIKELKKQGLPLGDIDEEELEKILYNMRNRVQKRKPGREKTKRGNSGKFRDEEGEMSMDEDDGSEEGRSDMEEEEEMELEPDEEEERSELDD
eukprot:TRINITY_DN1615_c0_g2_i1.p1 TRINITY_DN1615_c0_g2~~TRINITY_DN1615_c0_g2_i1.p1  ORF type:complete len:1042 (-),score=340.11 TRINITY_DN1615_c0_g2_i1:162-3287(-)